MRRKKQEAAKARYQEAKDSGDLLPFDSSAFESGKVPYNPDSPGGKSGLLPEDLPPVVFTTKNGIQWIVADMDWNCDDVGDPEEDQARWAPSANGKPVRLLGAGEAAEYTGVKARWIGLPSYIPFPSPDGYLGEIDDFFQHVTGQEGWLQSTLDKWNDRPGLGRRWTPREFLDRDGVIQYLRVPRRSPFAGVALPAPDVRMRRTKGWLLGTIDSWASQLPDGVLSPRPSRQPLRGHHRGIQRLPGHGRPAESRPVDDDLDYR
jgi:hypothetical protein